jgi:hypothetical protein
MACETYSMVAVQQEHQNNEPYKEKRENTSEKEEMTKLEIASGQEAGIQDLLKDLEYKLLQWFGIHCQNND